MIAWGLCGLVACWTSTSAPPKPPRRLGHGAPDVVPVSVRPLEDCADAPLVTLDELAAGAHAGARIAIDVVPKPQVMCTLMACVHTFSELDPYAPVPPSDGCCNACGGGYVVEHPGLRVLLTGVPGCGGMDCDWTCEPFGSSPTTRYRFIGLNTFEPRSGSPSYAMFSVERYCRLEAAQLTGGW